MGDTAENVAKACAISREDQDAYALRSQQRTHEAIQAGRFCAELIPVSVPQRKGPPALVERDEFPRETTAEHLAALKPVFRAGGSVTAGNSSGRNDGAAAVLLMEEETARRLGLSPIVRLTAHAVTGCDPRLMGLGPISATQKALERAGLTHKDLDLVELNEAFAAQTLACVRALGLDESRLNVNGGAIALGHPIGASGCRILTTLVHELKRRGGCYGLATLCAGGGMGEAYLVERC